VQEKNWESLEAATGGGGGGGGGGGVLKYLNQRMQLD
jgi:hypothetical protein